MVGREQRQVGKAVSLVEREPLAGDEPRPAVAVAEFVVAAEFGVGRTLIHRRILSGGAGAAPYPNSRPGGGCRRPSLGSPLSYGSRSACGSLQLFLESGQ